MEVFLYILFGFISGILGGMGMGGGTLLIPLLGFLPIEQHAIQAANLLSFIPMAVVALIFHSKNKLLRTKKLGYLLVPAVILGGVGAFVTKYVGAKVLKYCFGVLLIGLGVWQLIKSISSMKKSKS